MERQAKIFVAGHRGLVGGAIVRALERAGFANLVLRTHAELDLRDQAATRSFFAAERPEYVFLAAAKVGGIVANDTYRGEFIHDNLAIALHVIHAAKEHGVRKLLNLGSSCIYPRDARQPMVEDALLTGPLEPTNRPYAVAKIAAIELCDAYRAQYGCDFVSAMPTNLYGPGDNFDLVTSHVIPALVRKFIEASERNQSAVSLWGTGTPLREFLYVDDLADACLFIMDRFSGPGPLNVGTGVEISIRELAELVAELVGFDGRIDWDVGKPDGTPRKLLDVSKLRELGWQAKTDLRDGLIRTIAWYRDRSRG